jgi:hypothetical protein
MTRDEIHNIIMSNPIGKSADILHERLYYELSKMEIKGYNDGYRDGHNRAFEERFQP